MRLNMANAVVNSWKEYERVATQAKGAYELASRDYRNAQTEYSRAQDKAKNLFSAMGYESFSRIDAEACDEVTGKLNSAYYEIRAETQRLSAESGKLQAETKRSINLDNKRIALALNEQEKEDLAQQVAQWIVEREILNNAINAYAGENKQSFGETANRLFETITAGKWNAIEIGEGGKAMAVNAFGDKLEDIRLSQGTKQQMYLTLRLALLMTKKEAGQNIPVMCDDILVNFDAQRRAAAAKAIAQLALQRQVLLFTCHPEVVDVLKDADESLNLIELG